LPTEGRAGPLPAREPRVVVAVLAAVICGLVLPVQSRVNGALAERLGAAPAAVASFGTGLLLVTLCLADPRVRRGLGRLAGSLRTGGLRWWHLLGGVGGGLFVAAQTHTVPLLGVTAFLIAVIGGQTASALLVDRFGLGPGAAQGWVPGRVAAAGLAVTGVVVAATAPSRSATGSGAGLALLLVVAVVFCVGSLTSLQQAVNGRVGAASGQPLVSAWVNFAVGTTVLVLLAVPVLATGGAPTGWAAPWWAWTGGGMGLAFITLAAWAVQHIQLLTFALVTVTSQLTGGVLLDLVQPETRAALGPQVLLGVAVTLVAAVWSALAARAAARRRRTAVPAPG
jgi:bacterial/archaeal transporter family-2 protein